MKKLLALVLALVMTLSLATVSTNAAFEDAADISYDEAANVLSAVGVFVGDGKNFSPKAALNREQAAKLVAYLALGEDVAEALPSVSMFDDVAASSWAAKYIAYCADAGIITGDGAGKFYPAAPVDGYAFAKMLLCALGYKAEAEGYVGANWSINVATDAKAAGLNKGFKGDLNKNLTREEAAQLMFNAIKAEYVVSYSQSGDSITIGDVVVNQKWGNANLSVSGPNGATGKYYYENQWDSTNGTLSWTADHDDFGRDANKWTFEGKEVSRVADDVADFVITEKMTGKEVAALLKGYTINGYKVNNDTVLGGGIAAFANYSNDSTPGSLALASDTAAAAIYELTADGKLVEIYTDSNMKIDQIVCVSYADGQVKKVTTDKKTGVVTYKFSFGASAGYKHDEDTDLVFDCTLAEDDIVTYAYLNGKVYIYPTTKMTGALTSYDQDGVYTIAGDTYTKGATTWASTAYGGVELGLSDDDAEFWLDQYGYLVQAKGISAKSNDYAYVLGVNGTSNKDFSTLTVAGQVKLLLTDGTVGIYDIKVAKKDSKWYVNNSDGEYICAADASDSTADSRLKTALENKVVTYKLDGKTAALSLVTGTAAPDSTYVDKMYAASPDTYVEANDTKLYTDYAYDTDAIFTFMNDKTTYVFYDKVDEEVDAVVVGNNKLGDMEFYYDVATDVVVSYNEGGDKATTKYVFVFNNYAKDAASVDAYGFIDNSKYTTKLVKDADVYVYTMTLTDGTTISLTSKNGLADSGLYKYDTENEVEDDQYLFGTDARVYQGASQVDGSVLTVGGRTYNLTADTKVVDVSDDYDEADDACVIVYLDKDKKVVESMFIVDLDVLA